MKNSELIIEIAEVSGELRGKTLTYDRPWNGKKDQVIIDAPSLIKFLQGLQRVLKRPCDEEK